MYKLLALKFFVRHRIAWMRKFFILVFHRWFVIFCLFRHQNIYQHWFPLWKTALYGFGRQCVCLEVQTIDFAYDLWCLWIDLVSVGFTYQIYVAVQLISSSTLLQTNIGFWKRCTFFALNVLLLHDELRNLYLNRFGFENHVHTAS